MLTLSVVYVCLCPAACYIQLIYLRIVLHLFFIYFRCSGSSGYRSTWRTCDLHMYFPESTGTKTNLQVQAESWGTPECDSCHWKSTKTSVCSSFFSLQIPNKWGGKIVFGIAETQLSMSFNTSDAETHVCAVAACGEIWFGNSTKVNIQGTTGERWYNLQKCQYFMSIF